MVRRSRPDFEIDVLDAGGSTRIAFDVRELALHDRELVVAPWIEIFELIDTVEHIADQLLEEDSRSNADFAAKVTGDSRREHIDVRVVAALDHTLGCCRTVGIKVTYSPTDFGETAE